jgi:hypothetical protein
MIRQIEKRTENSADLNHTKGEKVRFVANFRRAVHHTTMQNYARAAAHRYGRKAPRGIRTCFARSDAPQGKRLSCCSLERARSMRARCGHELSRRTGVVGRCLRRSSRSKEQRDRSTRAFPGTGRSICCRSCLGLLSALRLARRGLWIVSPVDTVPKYLLQDRDAVYGPAFRDQWS